MGWNQKWLLYTTYFRKVMRFCSVPKEVNWCECGMQIPSEQQLVPFVCC